MPAVTRTVWIAMSLRRRHLELRGVDPDNDAVKFDQLKDSERNYWLALAKAGIKAGMA